MDGRAQRLVIVADDDAAIRLLCRVNLELEGYRVLEATGLEEISRIADEEEVALVLLDIHLGREDGIEVARVVRERRPEVPIAFLSGSVDFSERSAAVSDAAIRKPFTLEELIGTVHRLAGGSPPPRPTPPPTP
ncbi:MAG TPA: response regulator [Gaiellaceae bacterium]|nr:response regulator [Gaiellaceae bacterium]